MVPHLDLGDVAQPARMDHFNRLAIMLHAMLLRADLDNAVILFRSLDQGAPFANRVG